ncbi:MAG: GAF domain-containing protein [Candidatus Sericytochromatia bacterium]|nr:GAF domain-containing protein [Candidatus Sericytochromatia bacterium]
MRRPTNNTRLYEVAQQAREHAERSADRLRRLQTVSESLAQATTADDVCVAFGREVREALRAAFCWVGRVQPDGMRLPLFQSTERADTALSVTWHLSPEVPSPLGDATDSGEAIFLEDRAYLFAAYPEMAGLIAASGCEAMAAAPLIVDDRIVGVLAVGYDEPQTFADTDRDFFGTLTAQGATALERARLYSDSEHAVLGQEYLISVMAHDLKNPLSVIQMNAYMLESGSPKETKRIGSIMHASERICALIDNMVDLSSLKHGTLDVTLVAEDLAQVVRDATEAILLTLETRELIFEVRCPASLPGVLCDRRRIQQVLMTLLSFTAKRAPTGSALVLIVEPASAGLVRVAICDQGKPIADEQQNDLFDPYWQPPPGHLQGMGLGLAVVNGIIRAHGGRVSVESQAGTGTVFQFFLQTVPAAAD